LHDVIRRARVASSRLVLLSSHSNISNPTFAYKGTRLVISRIAKLVLMDSHGETSMKKLAIVVALAAALGSTLSGCIIVPDGGGGWHHHHDYYR
jgi:hypothetical protein